jgi:hypothetical protein
LVAQLVKDSPDVERAVAGDGPSRSNPANSVRTVLYAHTVPGEPEDLPATHPGVERAAYDGSQMRRPGAEEMLDLFRCQITDAALGFRQLLDA